MSGAHSQAFPNKRLDDFGGDDGLELLRVRILTSQIAEDVSAAANHVELLLVFHFSISFRYANVKIMGGAS